MEIGQNVHHVHHANWYIIDLIKTTLLRWTRYMHWRHICFYLTLKVLIPLLFLIELGHVNSSEPSVQSNSPSHSKYRGIHSCIRWEHWKWVALAAQPLDWEGRWGHSGFWGSWGLLIGSGAKIPPLPWFRVILKLRFCHGKAFFFTCFHFESDILGLITSDTKVNSGVLWLDILYS